MSFAAKLASRIGDEPARAYLFHREQPGALLTDPHATRRGRHYRQPVTAAAAVSRARADLIADVRRYPRERPAIGTPYGDRDKLQWIERPAAFGLRFLGFADEWGGRAIEHTGWYTDPEGMGDVTRGALYALPGRDGRTRIVAGYRTGRDRKGTWTDQAGSDESASLDLATVYVTDPREDARESDCDASRTAAFAADRIAERIAESEREYQESWQLGSDAAALIDSAKSARASARELLAEMRGKSANDSPAVCRTLRATVAGYLSDARDAYSKARDLWNEHANPPAWASHLDGAFQDGAGAQSYAESIK